MDENKRGILANILTYVALMIVGGAMGVFGVYTSNTGANLLGLLFFLTAFFALVTTLLRTTFDCLIEKYFQANQAED